MKNPKISTVEKPTPKVKTEQPVAAILTETTKPKKQDSAPKSLNKPKTIAPISVPEAKAEHPVLSAAEGAKPKKATASQKFPKKSKAEPPKAVVPASETAKPERASLPSDNIWPNWVENLLVNFGIKKK